MKCCNEIQELGCFGSCTDEIDTGLTADITGEWEVEIEFAGVTRHISLDLTDGDPIILPNKLNENYTYIMRIYKPIFVDDQEDQELFNNKCYSFNTYPETSWH